MYLALRETTLGWLAVSATEKGLTSVSFGDDRSSLERQVTARYPDTGVQEPTARFEGLVNAVVSLIEQGVTDPSLPRDVQGTPFQMRVWNLLCRIPKGQTVSYSRLAEMAERPGAVRAVASACAANRLAVVIPCHRVIGKDGSLRGYRWGIDRKRILLDREMHSCTS